MQKLTVNNHRLLKYSFRTSMTLGGISTFLALLFEDFDLAVFYLFFVTIISFILATIVFFIWEIIRNFINFEGDTQTTNEKHSSKNKIKCIKEHLEFLGYKIEKSKQNKHLYVAVHKEKYNIVFLEQNDYIIFDVHITLKDHSVEKNKSLAMELINKLNNRISLCAYYINCDDYDDCISVKAIYLSEYTKQSFARFIGQYETDLYALNKDQYPELKKFM